MASNHPRIAAAEGIKVSVEVEVDAQYAYLENLYRHFHANPELSTQEFETAARLADELRKAGFEVREKFGMTGIVGLLENGEGPTLLLRADMDALPVKESTGLDYASRVIARNATGEQVATMHACGHDMHMTVLVGSARVLASLQSEWNGTIILIGQPAEEIGQGAKAMLGAGLFHEYPVPDFAFAFHVSASMPAGTIGYVSGYALANVDSVDIVVKGRGGHGAYPHRTRDPVVLASQLVMSLQNIVSRISLLHR